MSFGQISALTVEAVKMTALSSWNLKAYFLSSLFITMDQNTLQIIDSRTKVLFQLVVQQVIIMYVQLLLEIDEES